MIWWLWLLVGLFLLLGELLTPGGFYLIFFGASAFVVGALAAAGLVVSPVVQWLLFSGLSILALALFRRPLLRWLGPHLEGKPVDQLAGEIAVALAALAPGEIGPAELRGAPWRARNLGATPIAAGGRCRVERVDGLLLEVRAETAS